MLKPLDFSNKYVISRFRTHRPIILTHSLTSKCNCQCKICHIWREKRKTSEMTTREVFGVLEEAKKLNFVAYVAWGGEPLMRPDTLEILEYAQELGLYTSLITNGTMLPEKADKLAGISDLTWVSLDHDSDYHDEMRGRKGVFKDAVEGILKLKRARGRVVINCVLSKMNMDAPERMARLARRLNVGVTFDPMEVFMGSNSEYALTPTECSSLFTIVYRLKKEGYPILNSYEFLGHFKNPLDYSCAQPKIFISVSDEGKVEPFWCKKTSKILGDLREKSLSEILNSTVYNEFTEATRGCNLCSNSTTVECAIFYSAKRFLINLYNPEGPYLKFIRDFGM
jgi:MoaA/NifB/PqqE/SkfB family radical SAM enzyme